MCSGTKPAGDVHGRNGLAHLLGSELFVSRLPTLPRRIKALSKFSIVRYGAYPWTWDMATT